MYTSSDGAAGAACVLDQFLQQLSIPAQDVQFLLSTENINICGILLLLWLALLRLAQFHRKQDPLKQLLRRASFMFASRPEHTSVACLSSAVHWLLLGWRSRLARSGHHHWHHWLSPSLGFRKQVSCRTAVHYRLLLDPG